jgi:predicted HTH transcriptional regulator
VFTLPNSIAELIQYDTTTLSVTAREGKHREFKRDFNANDFSEYTKTLAALSNADGGTLVFGVSEKPRLIIGINQIVDESQWANRLREDFDPEIVVNTKVYTVRNLQIFVVGVDRSPNRPVICRKNRSKQVKDKDGKVKDVEVLREGAIYFRYASQTRVIGYTELAAMLADRERRQTGSHANTEGYGAGRTGKYRRREHQRTNVQPLCLSRNCQGINTHRSGKIR